MLLQKHTFSNMWWQALNRDWRWNGRGNTALLVPLNVTLTEEGWGVWWWNITVFHLLYWEGEKKQNFPTLTLVPFCHENPDSLRKKSPYCALRLHILLQTRLHRPVTVLSQPWKDRRGGTNKATGTFNILTPFHLVCVWYGGQGLDWKHSTSHLTSLPSPWCLFWAF